MRRYIEAPHAFNDVYSGDPEDSVFLAGGITGCPNWQADATDMLAGTHWTIFNPRRRDFPMDDPSAAKVQIEWEFKHLELATAILFWFPAEAIQPIALYELGRWLAHPSQKRLYIGCHPDYVRRQDVMIQTQLARPGWPVCDTLDLTVGALRGYASA